MNLLECKKYKATLRSKYFKWRLVHMKTKKQNFKYFQIESYKEEKSSVWMINNLNTVLTSSNIKWFDCTEKTEYKRILKPKWNASD